MPVRCVAHVYVCACQRWRPHRLRSAAIKNIAQRRPLAPRRLGTGHRLHVACRPRAPPPPAAAKVGENLLKIGLAQDTSDPRALVIAKIL